MKKLFKWLLAVTGVLAVSVVLLLYNPHWFRGSIGTYLSKATGYSISLQGDLEIDLGGLLTINISHIHVTNPEQTNGQDLVTLDRLKLVLVTSSVFEETLLIDRLEIDRLQASLEISEDRTGNWEISSEPASPDNAGKKGTGLIVKNIQISNTTINHENRFRGQSYVLAIDSYEQIQNADGMLQINLDGSLNDQPVEYYGFIGTYDNLLAGRDISFSGEGQVGSLNISGEGRIDDLLGPKHPQFNLQMEGPEIDRITAMLGFDDLGSGGFSLRAVGGLVNGQYEAGIHGDIGDLSLNVSAKAPGIHDLEIFDLELAANGPSLGAVTHSVGITGWPDKPFSLEAKVTRVTTTLDISNLTLSVGGTRLTLDALLTNFPDLEASRIKLLIGGDDIAQFRELLGIRGIATGPFEVRGNLDVTPDKLELVHVNLETSLGKASLSGTLGKAPNYTGTKLNVHLDGHNARTLVSAFGIDALPEQPFNLNTNIELVDQGLQIEQGVLVTIDDDRLELGGLIVLEDDGVGSDLQFKVSGQDLVQLLHRLIGNFDMPAGPYALGGRVKLLGDSIELQDLSAEYEGIKLSANGRLKMDKQFEGTAFDFQVEGENLSSLGDFAVVGDSMDVFVPGQAYQARGNFAIEPGGFRLSRVSGKLGQTAFTVNGSLNPQSGWIGSDIHFSIQGPDLNKFLARMDEVDLPTGPFDTNGHLVLAKDKLKISDFNFETSKSSGNIDVELGWPVSASTDVSFDVMVQGDDIRRFLPKIRNFEPAQTNFNITAKGQKLDSRVSVQKFEARLGNLDVVIVGNLIEESEDESADLAFRATSNDLSTLGRLNGEQLPAMPLDLIADFKGNARQFKLQNISAKFGESNVTGSIDISLEKPRSTINLALQSDLIDLRPFLGTEEPATDSPDTDDSDRLIPATPLPIDALAAIDGVIDIKINEIRHKEDSLENFVLDAVVNNGELQVPQFTVEGPRGKLRGNLSIVPTSPEKADVKFGLHADQLVLNLSGKPDADLDIVPAFDLNLNITGSGGDLQELAASLNGSLQMGSEGGTLEGVDLSLLDTFILDEVFSLIMPKTEKDDDLELSCVALIWKAEDGKMKTNPAFAFTTKKISVIAKGSINLKTEAIKINFNATPNKALKISASELFNPYILVGGTLADPAVGLDPTNVIVHGGAAAATAGISILAKGLLDRIGNIAPLCEEMLKKIQETP
jgi:uncharacterized protein involved in outer membrane biogenesis